MIEHEADPGKRKAQHLLASEVLELVHGPEEAIKTRAEHQSMRSPNLMSLANSSADSTSSQTASSSQAAQRTQLPKSLVYNTPFGRILFHAGLVKTKSEGARLIAKGGAYVATPGEQSEGEAGELNFVPVKDQQPTDVENLVIERLLILRLGKWKVRVIEVVDDAEFEKTGQSVPGWEDFKHSR
jgi:tyrosyl-tRNA synthetase